MSDPAENGRPIGVAVLGMGNVGAEVVRILTEDADDMRQRVGAPVELRGVAVRDTSKPRDVDPALLTDDPASSSRATTSTSSSSSSAASSRPAR